MPSLADIYSAINTAKRKGADFVQNPGTSLQQMLGNANDRARALNEQDRAATDEFLATGQLNGPLQMQSAMDMAQAYGPVGMTVYHGSPHVFQKFDLSKMGTGEGNQAYGPGMYMAQNPNVAKTYAVDAANSNSQRTFAPKTNVNQNSINYFEAMLKGEVPRDIKNNVEVSDDYIKSQIAGLSNQLPSLYKVDLPDTHIRRMLDWDEPLKSQPAPVRKLAKSLGIDLNDAGADLLAQIGKGQEGKKILEKAGIRGIKYLDQESRNAAGWHITPPSNTVSGKWMVKGSDYNSKGNHFETEQEAKDFMKQKIGEATRNFVVFDPNHLTILERQAQTNK
jgi:hypothetical protein